MLLLNRRKVMLLQPSNPRRKKELLLLMSTAELVKIRKKIRSLKLMVFMPSKFFRVITI
jgi:hypothetical protein